MFRMTLMRDIICNALNRNYSMDQAAADLGSLITERERLGREVDAGTQRLRELEQLIPIQETLAIRKLRGDELFDRLALLGIRVEQA